MASITTGSKVVAAHDLLAGELSVRRGSPGRVVAISAYFTSIYTVEFSPLGSVNQKVTVNRLSGADLRPG